jgi:hypothetical protein
MEEKKDNDVEPALAGRFTVVVMVVAVVVMVALLKVVVVAVSLEEVDVTLEVFGERSSIGYFPTSSSTSIVCFERAMMTRTPGPLASTNPDQGFISDASLFVSLTLPPMR